MRNRTEIERLVATSYSALQPSASVEDAVRDALPAQRSPARRWPPAPAVWSAAAALLIGVVLALVFAAKRPGEPEASPDVPGLADGGGEIELPVVARPDTGVVPRSDDEVVVQVLGGRVLVLLDKDGWEQVSLDGFAAHLRAQRNQGGFVVVRADRSTPWRHLQWLMTVCAECKWAKLALAVRPVEGREFRLDATLPTDLPRAREVKVVIQVDEVDGGVRYHFGDTESVELASVARWFRDAEKAARGADAVVVGELRATGRTRWEHVARLLAEFRHAGIDPVQFYGTRVPTREERAARTLPAPDGVKRVTTPDRPFHTPEEEVVEEPIADPTAPAMIFDADTGDVAAIERAAAIVQRRLRAAGFDLTVTRDGRVLRVPCPKDRKRLAEARSLVLEQRPSLEFHLTVEPDAPTYEAYWLRLQAALSGGARFDEVRDVKSDDRARYDKVHDAYPFGLRWYRLLENARYAPSRLPAEGERYVLCCGDAYGITEKSLRDVVAAPIGNGAGWGVNFRVKREHQENMARLTRYTHGTYLAIIVNDRVHAAPRLQSTLADAGQISGGYTKGEAKTLAAMLTSEPLPVKFTLAAVESDR
jgi:biopolymer transport protein ExbD